MAANQVGDEISILEIHDKTLSHGVHAVFSSQNKFLVYGVSRGEAKIDLSNQHLHEITSKAAVYSDYVRKLVNESHGVFVLLNNQMQNVQDGRKNVEIPKISQKYRSILLACIEDLHTAAELTKDEELFELREMFTNIELIWHLMQCLIVDSHSGARVLYKLLDWIKWHFCLAEIKMGKITDGEEPANHPDYWDTIIQFLLQGKVTSARNLLALHPRFENPDFASLDELIHKMPTYFSTCVMSLNEFRIRWKHWQEECKVRLQRGEYSVDPNLQIICKLLCGDTDILTEKSSLCCNWYHLMISVQLYTDPCISLSALGDIARAFYTNVVTKPSVVDSIILAVMELDKTNIINLLCSFNDSWWFAVHMMDILVHGGHIEDDPSQSYLCQYRNNLLENYAEILLSHSSLWVVGVDYLDQCQERGRELLELYLEKIPLKTEAKAKRLIHIARKRNMENLVKSVANVMISKAMANGKLGTALSWIIYSKDSKFADELADRWMSDYVNQRKFECFEVLHSCMLVSDKLTFVGKYCEFHKLYSAREFKVAGNLLVSLISSGIAPPNFQMIMLLDALPLLESIDLIFSSKDTYQLMKCLEDIVLCNEKNVSSGSGDNVNLIRLALVRNLSRSFVLEPDDSDSED